MKDKNYKSKQKIDKLRKQLVKPGDYVIWAISPADRELFENKGFIVEECLYWIYPNRHNYSNHKASALVRKVHFKMNGRKTPFALKLKPEEVKELRDCNYRVTVYKYKIIKPVMIH